MLIYKCVRFSRIEATSLRYWISINEELIVSPANYPPVNTLELINSINAQLPLGDAVIVYDDNSAKLHTSAHFIMVQGSAFYDDLTHFETSLQAYFASGNL